MAENVVIIGSGPAAWTAAIYAARANLKPLVYEGAVTEENRVSGTLPLGQLALTTEVENYPGFPAGDLSAYLDNSIAPERCRLMAPHEKHGISGPELMELMRQQAANFGTRIVTDDIVEVDFSRRPFTLVASRRRSRAGRRPSSSPPAPGPTISAWNRKRPTRIAASAPAPCATVRCRASATNRWSSSAAAIRQWKKATYFSKFASRVHMVHRRDALRASKIMADRAANDPKIEIAWNSEVDEVLGNPKDGVTGVRMQEHGRWQRRDLAASRHVLGHRPHAQHGASWKANSN